MNLPTGSIIIWSGTTIPTGWVLCDGNNGTPNLVGKFVRGAANDTELGNTGGGTSHSHTNPSLASVGNHTHTGITVSTGSSDFEYAYGYTVGTLINPAGNHDHGNVSRTPDAGGSHAHTVSPTNSDANSSLPPYKILVFIMKVDE